jgi:hypothetical protein
MQTIPLYRLHRLFGIVTGIVLALLLLGTDTGRNTLGWIYLQSTEGITSAAHIRSFPLDRLDPTCPQCM